MENNFNTPAQVFEANMKAGEGKVQLPLLKCILLGLMAGAFIAFGGATSSAAIHNISNQGVAKALAGAIFPVGLMMIVFVGGELFTGDCLMLAGVVDKRFSALQLIKTLIIVWFSNMAGAILIAANMFYIPAGIIAATNDTYVAKAEELYGITAAQISASVNVGGFISNLIPVTIGNILGGMVFVALPLYVIHKKKA